MSYKAFAAITLIAAPVIALVAQNLVPQSPHSLQHAQTMQPMPTVQPTPVPLPVVQAAPAPAAVAAPPAPAEFGRPTPGAGQPFLSAGSGLPGGGEAAAAPARQMEPDDNNDAIIVRSD